MYRGAGNYSDMKHNFAIFKMVVLLYKFEIVSRRDIRRHIAAIEHGKPAGLVIDYMSFQYMEGNGMMVNI